MLLRLALLLLLLPAPVHAGAWPRDRGSWFVASAVELRYDPELVAAGVLLPAPGSQGSVWLEYGLTGRVTVGLDLARSLGLAGEGKALGFVRLDLSPGEDWKLAASAALGRANGGGAVQAGLHLGRGITLLGASGWMALDVAMLRVAGTPQPLWKADLTLGLRPRGSMAAMVQLQGAGWSGGGASLRVAPSVAIPFGRMEIEMGASLPLAGGGAPGMRIGLWQRF